jgi:hypothetical protein
MKEVVGNLVVTDLQKYLQKPFPSPSRQSFADVVNEVSKRKSYDFNRVRKSVVDAYEGIYLNKNSRFQFSISFQLLYIFKIKILERKN